MGKVFCRSCGEVHKVSFQPSRDELGCPTCGETMGALPKERDPSKGLKPNPDKPLKRTAPPRTSRGISPASPAQGAKVAALGYCIACGKVASDYVLIDPAHLCARGLGGCDSPDCVVGLCRTFDGGCHRLFDQGEAGKRLDLLSIIAARWPAEKVEVQHMLEHMLPVPMIEQLANQRTQWTERPAALAHLLSELRAGADLHDDAKAIHLDTCVAIAARLDGVAA